MRRYHKSGGRGLDRERSLNETIDRSSQALGMLLQAGGESPSRMAQQRELGVILADALAELSEEHREVIVLRNLRELKWPEVGQRMERTPDAVRMLWARALTQLRPRIEDRL